MSLVVVKAVRPEAVTLPFNISLHTYTGTRNDRHTSIALVSHHHPAFEMIYTVHGELQVNAEDTEYHLQKGDVVLCNSHDVHSGRWIDNGQLNQYLCLTFTPHQLFGYFTKSVLSDAARELYQMRARFDRLYRADTASARLFGECMEKMYSRFYDKTPLSECSVLLNMYAILEELMKTYADVPPSQSVAEYPFILSVSEFISQHFHENISTADTAEALHLTLSQFCHRFKQNFGCSFLKYLNEYRINESLRCFNEEISISQIAERVGFSDYCHFSKTFKKIIGVTPSMYFQKRYLL